MIYLASPYSHPDPAVRRQRFDAACRGVVLLMQRNRLVFSVVHSHPLAELGLPTDWAFWQTADRAFLERCDELIVLMLDGWHESTGVQAEIQLATELGKPVWYFAPASVTAPELAMEGSAHARTSQ